MSHASALGHEFSRIWCPRDWQQYEIDRLQRFNVLVVHRQAGKTDLACALLIDTALSCKLPRPQLAYIAPQLKQAKRVAWRTLKRMAAAIPGAVVHEREAGLWVPPSAVPHEQETFIEFPNGALLYVLGADDPDTLRGMYLDACVVDEIAQMRGEVWGEILLPALESRGGWALAIGTSKGMNLLSKLYYEALDKGTANGWYAHLLTVHETNVFSPTQIGDLRANSTERQFRQEWECDFSAGTEDALFNMAQIRESQGRILLPDAYSWAPLILGGDVARYGNDKSVITPRRGLMTYEPRAWHGLNNIDVASKFAEAYTEFHADAIFVDVGGGQGVIDILRGLGFPAIAVNFGGTKGVEAGFRNKKAEMYDAGVDWIEAGGKLPPSERLAMDLCVLRYGYSNAAEAMEITTSKEDIKAQNLPSTDYSDSWVLTFAHPVAPPGGRHVQRGPNAWSGPDAVQGVDYDPLNDRQR